MAKMHANFKNSPRHEEVKKTDRIRKMSRARTLNYDTDDNEVSYILGHATYVLFVCNCYLSFAQFLMMYSASSYLLMVTFRYARHAERN